LGGSVWCHSDEAPFAEEES